MHTLPIARIYGEMDSLCQNISLSTVFCPSDFAKAIATNMGVKFIKINKIDEPIADSVK